MPFGYETSFAHNSVSFISSSVRTFGIAISHQRQCEARNHGFLRIIRRFDEQPGIERVRNKQVPICRVTRKPGEWTKGLHEIFVIDKRQWYSWTRNATAAKPCPQLVSFTRLRTPWRDALGDL
jgi:hypothetical protein